MQKKTEIITFKADGALLEAIQGIENRSQFIREAIFAALQNTCPLCQGTGTLTINQRQHWHNFTKYHSVKECLDCHEAYLVCDKSQSAKAVDKKVHAS